MAIYGTQFLERIQFFNGERLFASDLQSLETFNREMRWLHNQSLHQAGIGSGYAVAGARGDRQVTVTPGYALNSMGQEIILTENHVEPIPPVADNGAGASVFYDLTVSYPDDTDLKPSETRDGICLPAGAVRLREEPVFCWVQLGDDGVQPVDSQLKDRIQAGLFIVLTRIEVFNCQLKQPVSIAQRKNARPSRQPYIAAGEYTPAWASEFIGSATKAEVDLSLRQASFPPVVFSAVVDTKSGGFQAVPDYTARLIGERVGHDQQTPPNFWIQEGLIEIVDTKRDSFRLKFHPSIWPVFVSEPTPSPLEVTAALFAGWRISWIGIES
jgi:hypothetical protein